MELSDSVTINCYSSLGLILIKSDIQGESLYCNPGPQIPGPQISRQLKLTRLNVKKQN